MIARASACETFTPKGVIVYFYYGVLLPLPHFIKFMTKGNQEEVACKLTGYDTIEEFRSSTEYQDFLEDKDEYLLWMYFDIDPTVYNHKIILLCSFINTHDFMKAISFDGGKYIFIGDNYQRTTGGLQRTSDYIVPPLLTKQNVDAELTKLGLNQFEITSFVGSPYCGPMDDKLKVELNKL